jgi:polyhydroxybutyrate depolymerase
MSTRSTIRSILSACVTFAVALSLSGCGIARAHRAARRQTAPATQGSSTTMTGHITVDGRSRSYRLHRPVTVGTQGPVPLVVMLHGGFGSAKQAESSYGWDALADREGVMVVYPDGVGRAWNVGGGCCGQPGRAGVDDVAFVRALVTALSAEYAVDQSRVFATGISNGGMMTYRLACDSDVFAAIGVDAATLLGSCDGPHPVSVMHIHGLADTKVRFDGSRGDGVTRVDGPPVRDVIESWRSVDDCTTPVETSDGPVHTSAAACADGRAVTLVTLDGAGHQWPVGAGDPGAAKPRAGADPPSTALSATDTFWAFFAAHPRV